MALALDLMGGRLFQKEFVEKGPILGHFFEKCPKMSKIKKKYKGQGSQKGPKGSKIRKSIRAKGPKGPKGPKKMNFILILY